jgi:hypothetical protein
LVNEIIPSEIIPLIWFSGIAITGYVFFHKFSDVIKEKIKRNVSLKKKTETNNEMDDQLDSLISNAPKILMEIDQQINEQRAKGVTEDQLSGLVKKRQMIELVANNSEIINIIGKPILKKVLGFVKGI